jgi:hypothetical protein
MSSRKVQPTDSPRARGAWPRPIRSDGWTGARQLVFLQALAGTRRVSAAAAAAGMSRESAYRLRRRPEGALFALLWDRALAQPTPRARLAAAAKSHIEDGAMLRHLSQAMRRRSRQGHENAEDHPRP